MNPQFLPPPETAGEPSPTWLPLVALSLFGLATVGLTLAAPGSTHRPTAAFVPLELADAAPRSVQPSF